MTDINVDKAIDLKKKVTHGQKSQNNWASMIFKQSIEFGIDVGSILDILKLNNINQPNNKKVKLGIRKKISKRTVQLVQKSK